MAAETHHPLMDAVSHALGGSESKPPKVISHMVHRKSANGDHIFEHHHTHPEHHPKEEHTKRGDDEMVEHMMQHAGTPNPGEAEADAGNPDAGAQVASAGPTGSGDMTPGAGGAAPMAMGA
jgi:hypothetical protein